MPQIIRRHLRSCPLSGYASDLLATSVAVLDMPMRATEKLAHAWLDLWGME